MAYSDFDLKKVKADFELIDGPECDLFEAVPPCEPSEELRRWLRDFSGLAINFGSELARTVYLLGPIFGEVMRRAQVSVFTGIALDVDKAKGLTGVCDHLITRSRERHYLAGPVCAIVEAKKEDIGAGLGQCAAEMVAARLFNERDKNPLPAIYGCVTTGNVWRFLKLEGQTLFIDRREYYLSELPKLLGILVGIAAPA